MKEKDWRDAIIEYVNQVKSVPKGLYPNNPKGGNWKKSDKFTCDIYTVSDLYRDTDNVVLKAMMSIKDVEIQVPGNHHELMLSFGNRDPVPSYNRMCYALQHFDRRFKFKEEDIKTCGRVCEKMESVFFDLKKKWKVKATVDFVPVTW